MKTGFHCIPLARNKELEKDFIIMSKVELMMMMSLGSDKEVNKWFPAMREKNFLLGTVNIVIKTDQIFYNDEQVFPKAHNAQTGQEVRLLNLPEFDKTRFPFLRLYAIINQLRNDMEGERSAAYQLAKAFEISTDDIFTSVAISNPSWMVSHIINCRYRYPVHEHYDFTGEHEIYLYKVVHESIWGQDVLLPVTHWMKMEEVWPIGLNIMPMGKHPLFNLNLIRSNNHSTIVLTEHLEIANRRCVNESEPWVSWYGGIAAIEHVDWRPLYGRCVRYVLYYYPENAKEHAKEHAKENIETAMKLYDKFLLNENMQNFKVIKKNIYYNSVDLWGSELSDEVFLNLAVEHGVYIPERVKEYLRKRFIEVADIKKRHEPNYILEPVIKHKNLVVLYAPAGIGKTWLGISIGLAVAGGCEVFEGWKAPVSRRVFYVLGEMAPDEIENRVFDLKKVYSAYPDCDKNLTLRRVRWELSEQEDQLKVERDIRELNSRDPKNKVSLLILDNLTTLVKNGDYRSGWDNFFKWLEKLKNGGITVLLIHHANREGNFLGTGAIKNKTDFLIEASDKDEILEKIKKMRNQCISMKSRRGRDIVKAEIQEFIESQSNSTIDMYITAKKLRSSSKRDFAPIKISLNPEEQFPRWHVTKRDYYKLTEEPDNPIIKKTQATSEYINWNERLALKPWKLLNFKEKSSVLYYLLSNGMSSQDVAEKFKVTKRTIDNARKATNTRRSELMKRMEKENAATWKT